MTYLVPVAGICGLLIGYFLGLRAGRTAVGEKDMPKSSRGERPRRRIRRARSTPRGQGAPASGPDSPERPSSSQSSSHDDPAPQDAALAQPGDGSDAQGKTRVKQRHKVRTKEPKQKPDVKPPLIDPASWPAFLEGGIVIVGVLLLSVAALYLLWVGPQSLGEDGADALPTPELSPSEDPAARPKAKGPATMLEGAQEDWLIELAQGVNGENDVSQDDVRNALVAACEAMGEQDFESANRHLAAAEDRAVSVEQQALVRRLNEVKGYVREFWVTLRQTVSQLGRGETLQYESYEFQIVAASPSRITLAYGDNHKTLHMQGLPNSLAAALADQFLDRAEPANLLRYGAFLMVTFPQDDDRVQTAIRGWQQAASAGLEMSEMMLALKDLQAIGYLTTADAVPVRVDDAEFPGSSTPAESLPESTPDGGPAEQPPATTTPDAVQPDPPEPATEAEEPASQEFPADVSYAELNTPGAEPRSP